MSNPVPKVIAAGLDETALSALSSVVNADTLHAPKSKESFLEASEKFNDGDYSVAVCGGAWGDEFALEFAQLMSQLCTSAKLIFVTPTKEQFRTGDLKKNGFHETFLLPLDRTPFIEAVALANSSFKNRLYRPVFLMDMDPSSKLEFETYVNLPLNKKFIRFSNKGQSLGEERANKLKSKEASRLFLDLKDMDHFYEHTANRLRSVGGQASEMTETERVEKLKSSVRQLFVGLLDPSQKSDLDSGKEMMVTCQKIISNYVTKGRTNNWYADLTRALGGAQSSYDHAASVSALAALFAMGLQHPRPEDLALAGFLHDIGRAQFPDEFVLKDPATWTEDEKKQYEAHPLNSVNLVKERKMIISQEVEKAILQHHERWDGKGFPRQLANNRISEEAQILSLADQFHYLTMTVSGRPKLGPMAAISEISKSGSISGEMVTKVKTLLDQPK